MYHRTIQSTQHQTETTKSTVPVQSLLSRATRELMIETILEENGLRPNELLARKFYKPILCSCLMAAGQSRYQTAKLLDVQPDTIKKYEQRLRERFNADNDVHAFQRAKRECYIIEVSAT